MNKKILFLVMILSFACFGCVTEYSNKRNSNQVQNNELMEAIVKYKGEYASLDYERVERDVNKVLNSDIDFIKKVMNDPNNYEPPILFAYAHQVFLSGQYDIAMFWYYTAQIRARSDANKSLDKSVQKGVTELSIKYGQLIGKFALENPSNLENVMHKVLEWDEISERKYNPKWVAILGDEAKFGDKIRFVPENKYQQIDEEVRKGWEKGFKAAIVKIKNNE